jgi:hypothetical protein
VVTGVAGGLFPSLNPRLWDARLTVTADPVVAGWSFVSKPVLELTVPLSLPELSSLELFV